MAVGSFYRRFLDSVFLHRLDAFEVFVEISFARRVLLVVLGPYVVLESLDLMLFSLDRI